MNVWSLDAAGIIGWKNAGLEMLMFDCGYCFLQIDTQWAYPELPIFLLTFIVRSVWIIVSAVETPWINSVHFMVINVKLWSFSSNCYWFQDLGTVPSLLSILQNQCFFSLLIFSRKVIQRHHADRTYRLDPPLYLFSNIYLFARSSLGLVHQGRPWSTQKSIESSACVSWLIWS